MAVRPRPCLPALLLAGLMIVSCAPRDAAADFHHPPEASYREVTARLELEAETVEVRVARVTPGFFDVIDRPAWLGRTFVAEDFTATAEPVVVLGLELLENRLGGSPRIVGGTLRLDGRDHRVLGVMPREIEWPPGAQLWVPRTQ